MDNLFSIRLSRTLAHSFIHYLPNPLLFSEYSLFRYDCLNMKLKPKHTNSQPTLNILSRLFTVQYVHSHASTFGIGRVTLIQPRIGWPCILNEQKRCGCFFFFRDHRYTAPWRFVCDYLKLIK